MTARRVLPPSVCSKSLENIILLICKCVLHVLQQMIGHGCTLEEALFKRVDREDRSYHARLRTKVHQLCCPMRLE